MRNELGLDTGSKLEITERKGEIVLKPIGDDLDKVYAESDKIKPKHNLTPEQMDKLNERLFR